ncbi:MAG TPA: hypothetical protein VFS43_11900 [Polyangiaceae bacterium]|nr:hypothetical protein [Polyangiaceae bacterium]
MSDLDDRLARIEGLVAAIEASADGATRAAARELTAAVLGLHAAALERLLARIAASPGGVALAEACGRDPLVAAVLGLHGLHPVPVEARVKAALEGLRPRLQARGAVATLRSFEAGSARVRLDGPAALKPLVEEAIAEAAPDLAALEIEAVERTPLVQLRVPGRGAG